MNDLGDSRHWAVMIAAYLARSPHAGDTVEGIARWWLGADPADWPQIQLALLCLERDRAVVRYIAADGREHFRIGPGLGGTGACT